MNQVSIVDQIERIGDKRNLTAFIIGGIIGAFVPVAVYTLTTHVKGDAGSHVDVVKAWEESLENKLLLNYSRLVRAFTAGKAVSQMRF